VAELILKLVVAKFGVERHHREAGLRGGEEGDGPGDAVGEVDRQPVTGHQSTCPEGAGQEVGLLGHCRAGEPLAPLNQAWMIGLALGEFCKTSNEVSVIHAVMPPDRSSRTGKVDESGERWEGGGGSPSSPQRFGIASSGRQWPDHCDTARP
jgi:hypothetical protein